MTLRFDAYIFDLDGTLLDTMPDFIAVTNHTLAQAGHRTYTPEEIYSFFGSGLLGLLRQALPASASEEEVQQVLALWNEIFAERGLDQTAPYPQVNETLQVLAQKGAQLAVFSNKRDDHAKRTIMRYLPNTFRIVRGEGPDYPRKPNPTGLIKIMEEIGSLPKRTVYVGDSAGDVRAARNAGIFSVAVDYGYGTNGSINDDPADITIASFEQLLTL